MAIVYSATWDVDTESPDGSANMTRVTSPVHDGAGAVRLHPTADVAFWLKNAVGGAQNTMVFSAWMHFATLPSVNIPDVFGTYMTGPNAMCLGYDKTSGKMYCEIGSQSPATPGGPVLVAGTWYAVNFKVVASGATATVDGKVDGQNLTQNTVGGGPYTGADYRLGEYQTNDSYDLIFDTLNVSHTASDYPLLVTSGKMPTSRIRRLG